MPESIPKQIWQLGCSIVALLLGSMAFLIILSFCLGMCSGPMPIRDETTLISSEDGQSTASLRAEITSGVMAPSTSCVNMIGVTQINGRRILSSPTIAKIEHCGSAPNVTWASSDHLVIDIDPIMELLQANRNVPGLKITFKCSQSTREFLVDEIEKTPARERAEREQIAVGKGSQEMLNYVLRERLWNEKLLEFIDGNRDVLP